MDAYVNFILTSSIQVFVPVEMFVLFELIAHIFFQFSF
jgi:hypothetical protein